MRNGACQCSVANLSLNNGSGK
jgi:hypothetical protein